MKNKHTRYWSRAIIAVSLLLALPVVASGAIYTWIAEDGGNILEVAGPASLLRIGNNLRVGSVQPDSERNEITVRDGGQIIANAGALLGEQGSRNLFTVTGEGSLFWVGGTVRVGNSTGASENEVFVLDGGVFDTAHGVIGSGVDANNNSLTVSGEGSAWRSTASPQTVVVGWRGSNNTLSIQNGGHVESLGGNVLVTSGTEITAADNSIDVFSGALLTADKDIHVRHGTLRVEEGTVRASVLFADTDSGGHPIQDGEGPWMSSMVDFRSGLLDLAAASFDMDTPFTVGDGGANPAVYSMRGDHLELDDAVTIPVGEGEVEYEESFEWSMIYDATRMPDDPEAVLFADVPFGSVVTADESLRFVSGSLGNRLEEAFFTGLVSGEAGTGNQAGDPPVTLAQQESYGMPAGSRPIKIHRRQSNSSVG